MNDRNKRLNYLYINTKSHGKSVKDSHDKLIVYIKTLRGLPQKFIQPLTGKRGVRFIDTQLLKVKEKRPDLPPLYLKTKTFYL